MRIRSSLLSLVVPCLLLAAAAAQDAPKAEDKPQGPPVKVNYINVCTPNAVDTAELKTALDSAPKKAAFAPDFEVTRGRSSLQKAEPARYIRLRREFSSNLVFSNVQYSLSTDASNTIETLVLKVKDPKDLISLALEDQVSASATAPASVLDVNTPVSRIKLERFGKVNVVLARCPNADQSAYEPLFAKATALLGGYRQSLGLRTMFRLDINWLSSAQAPAKPKPAAKTKAATPPAPK